MSWLSPEPRKPNGKWRNRKSGKVREGFWIYRWASDTFDVRIKGCPRKHVYGDEPEYGDWKLVREGDE